MFRTLSAFLLAIILLTGCRPGRIYEEYHKFDKYTWERFDKVKFEIPVEEAGAEGDIVFTIRHITQYPYPNLPVNIILTTPSGEERILEKDIRLKDENDRFTGSVAGDLWDVEVTLWPGFYFHEAGTYAVEFENLIPKMGIPGLVDIGLYVKKREKK